MVKKGYILNEKKIPLVVKCETCAMLFVKVALTAYSDIITIVNKPVKELSLHCLKSISVFFVINHTNGFGRKIIDFQNIQYI